MVGLGAALPCRSGLATAGPNLLKVCVIAWRAQDTALVLDSHVHLLVVRKAGTIVYFRGPASRILEKQNGRTMNAPIPKKRDSSATSFAFQGF
jgi:hypothetical protein